MLIKLYDKNTGVATKTSYLRKLIKNKENNDIVKEYINNFPQYLNYDNNILLKTAIKSNNNEIVKELVNQESVNINSNSGKPLIYAVEYLNLELIKVLLNKKEINVKERNFKAFRIALENFGKDHEIVHLFEKKVLEEIKRPLDLKLLMLCFLQHNYYDYFVEYHQKFNFDINSDNGLLFRTACKLSNMYHRSEDFIEYMLKQEDLNPNLKEGEALVLVAENNRLDLIKNFYKSGKFNFSVRNNKIIREAIKRNHLEIFNFFIDIAKVKPIEHEQAALKVALQSNKKDYALKLLTIQEIKKDYSKIIKNFNINPKIKPFITVINNLNNF